MSVFKQGSCLKSIFNLADKALIANTSAFSVPVALATKKEKGFVLTIKPLPSVLNILIKQLQGGKSKFKIHRINIQYHLR